MAVRGKISLVLADVDGTLVTEQKVVTKRTRSAVKALQDAGIRFAVTSGRPPRGMAMLFDPLNLNTPIAGFNGGLFVERDLTILAQRTVPADVARQAIDLIRAHGLDVWVYRGNDWLIAKADAPHVAREAWTVKFEPSVVADVGEELDKIAKIVGVSDDHERVRRCEADAQTAFAGRATGGAIATVLSRYHQQRMRTRALLEFLSSHMDVPAGGDRHDRRSTQRRADVRALGV